MGEFGTLLFFIAGTRLASHPVWKKDKDFSPVENSYYKDKYKMWTDIIQKLFISN